MGYLVKCYCNKCDYQQTFRLGCGIADCKIERIYSHFDFREQARIKHMILKNKYQIRAFNYRLGRCIDCGKLFAVPEVTFDNGTTYRGSRFEWREKLEHNIELISEDMVKTICPKCGNIVEIVQDGIWD